MFQSAAQAAQLAAAAAGSNSSLAAVAMGVPTSNSANKNASNGNKPQGQGQQQGQAQGQGAQNQGQGAAAAPPALVAGKPAMLPQQSGTPLMLGQIGKRRETRCFAGFCFWFVCDADGNAELPTLTLWP